MKKITTYIKELIKEEYKFIIFLIIFYILLNFPLNYYIITGGGTSNVESRVEVENKNKSKGSFNISYVKELKGTIITYGLSYIIPTWERESANSYKYYEEENIDDIEFRNELDLKVATATATYWAYTLANEEIKEVSSKMYVITIIPKYETPFKVGDQILKIDGNPCTSIEEARSHLQTKNEEDEITISILRNKKEKEIKTKLYKEEDRLIMGIGLQVLKEYDTKRNVKIKFKKSESGPSGGLITTLEMYNQLTKKDYTKGLKIVGTGTIEKDGTIGKIGGIEYKLLGANSDKADVFLVPSGNYKEAVKYKKSKKLKIKLIEVKTIQDAIEKLEKLK